MFVTDGVHLFNKQGYYIQHKYRRMILSLKS